MSLANVIAEWGSRREIACKRVLPARPARHGEWPEWLDARVRFALQARGAMQPYSHQAEAWAALHAGRDLVVATPTASGKSLCYHAPVLDALVRDPAARALYLYPTKALARDQIEELRALGEGLAGAHIGVAVYDGDTPGDERRAVRGRAQIIATNPDMLHSGILPHHDRWAQMFAGLKYVVVDELHVYRGVFGSHVANVLRRLRRVAEFHGAKPQFVATSATIANPGELGEAVLGGDPPVVVSESGAPCGERTFLVYNPPVVDSALGIRASYVKCAERIARDLVTAGTKTLMFARSRQNVEILVRYLRDHGAEARGYRAGYLPGRRREVEREMRAGEAPCVVATSALELGIDIGALDAVVIAGWPGSRAATWQQAGRAGRRQGPSLAVLVATSEPMDQYVAGDPEYLFGRSPEQARVDPDNLAILLPHVKCAAFELPFEKDETFGPLDPDTLHEVLKLLVQQGALHHDRGKWHWIGESYPASHVSLRGPFDENFVVVENGAVLAEVDAHDAPLYLHPSAIYQLEGRTYQVARLDWDARKAYVDAVDADHYTDAIDYTKIRVLATSGQAGVAAWGDVHVERKVVGFKKIKYHTHENIGYGEVNLPAQEIHTRAAWFDVGVAPPDAVLGAAYALHHVSALLLMCDTRDLVRVIEQDPQRIYLYDACPGGTGLSERIFEERAQVTRRARGLVAACACNDGCPSCIGAGRRSKAQVVELLAWLEEGFEELRAAS
jgi:DEAD/DEAH box helicase domain-containing protein